MDDNDERREMAEDAQRDLARIRADLTRQMDNLNRTMPTASEWSPFVLGAMFTVSVIMFAKAFL